MNFISLVVSRPGSRAYTVLAPRARVNEIIEEYRLLDWQVSW